MTPQPWLGVLLAAQLSAAGLLAQAAPAPAAQAAPGPREQATPAQERAAPEAPVRLAVRKAKPSPLAGAGRALKQTLRRLWERDEPAAADGNALLGQNDVPGALKAYGEAEGRVQKGSEAAAALALNRSGALLRQGAEEAPQALEQAARALAWGDPATRAKAAYDSALALESAGRTDEAIAAYGRALSLDADDDDAKVNLELLLRAEERKRRQPSAGPRDDKEKQQQQGDSKAPPQAKGDSGKKDEPPTPATANKDEPPKDGQKQGQPGQQGAPKPEQGKEPQEDPKQAGQDPKDDQGQGGQNPKPPGQPEGESGEQARKDGEGGARVDRSEAQRLLDALRASEKNLQTWRFGKRARDARRRASEKDW